MKNVIILGASGMVGSHLLENCLSHSEIEKVTSLARKPSGLQHPKLNEVVVPDFQDYSGIEDLLVRQDIAFFCIGVYTGAVARDKFREITVGYPVSFAKALFEASPNATFCLLSGAGADRTEKSRVMFAKDKGSAENQLAAVGFPHFHAFRPGYIYPVAKRKEPNISYRIMRPMYPLIRLFGKKYSIKSTELAEAMLAVGLRGASQEILENQDILQQLEA